MRRIIMRLVMAKLVPVAIGFVTKAFRKRKSAAKPNVDANPNLDGINEAQNLDVVDKVTD